MYAFTLRSLLSSPAARLLSLLGSERPSRFFASCHNMLANAPSSPITTTPPHLRPRQDVTTTVDSAASSSSLLSVQMEVFGYFYGIEVTAPGTVTVPSEELYFECPDGAEDTWKEATTENQDLGQETSGQRCLVSYTGTFAQAWYMGAITWEAGVYGCQCIWEDLGGLGEHTVRVLNPSPGYNGGGQLWINGLIYATDTQVYTTQTGTVVPTHSAPSYTSGQSTSSTISSKPSNTQSSTSIAIATSDSASASLTADTASSTSTSSTDSPSSSASASSSPGSAATKSS
ncbi:hypothetical protein BCR35DRAFT_344561 [Leucosporidium creatinivorum]|uniref:Uncharacterized protein n=1 Tax=Leucosporidium creatinivorum TaxID=106004 RepID=A0A1Y2ENE8_9BASI|nr:hypothetical protein BCR35DRAFT_344561 [Leucosporidium creatinivorum]